MSELLPCPFCGGEAKVNTMEWVGGYTATALCKNEPNAHYLNTWDEDEAKAVERITKAWNTRADRTCYADEVTHRNCKYSVNRGWRERTCRIDYERHCSNCGVYVRDEAVLVRKDLDDGAWTVVPKPINYCPNCGARVTPKNSETTPKVVSE